jgi:hypothetical protein
MDVELPLVIRRQPDYATCGPTSLHAVCWCFQDPIPLEQVVEEVPKNPEGGTLAVHVALHAGRPRRRGRRSPPRGVHRQALLLRRLPRIAAAGIQIHGGLGFTWQQDLHLYYKRARARELALGDAGWHREEVAPILLDADPGPRR